MDAMRAAHLGRTIALTELAVDLTTLQHGAPAAIAQGLWSYAAKALSEHAVTAAIEEARRHWPGAPAAPHSATELWSFASAARAWASSNLTPSSAVARSLRIGLAAGGTIRAAHLTLAAPDPAYRTSLRLDPWEAARAALGDVRTNLGWSYAAGPLPEPLGSLAGHVRAGAEALGPAIGQVTARDVATRTLQTMAAVLGDPFLWAAFAGLPSDGGVHASSAAVPVAQQLGEGPAPALAAVAPASSAQPAPAAVPSQPAGSEPPAAPVEAPPPMSTPFASASAAPEEKAPARRPSPGGAARVHEVLERFARKEADVDDALRALLSHDDWVVPVALTINPSAPERVHDRLLILGDGSGELAPGGELWAFTDDASAKRAAEERTTLPPHVGGVSGVELFAAMARHTGIRKLRVNPRSPVERTFFAEDDGLEFIQERAKSIGFEARLAQPGPRDDAFWEAFLDAGGLGVFRFPNGAYLTMTTQVGHLSNPILVFTGPDCARSFLAALPEAQRTSLAQVVADPAKLLDMLAASPDFDGACFNPMGPGPRALLDRADLLALHTPSGGAPPSAPGASSSPEGAAVHPGANAPPFPAALPPPATMFVAGQLRHLVALHFDRLAVLTRAGQGASGALGERVKERLAELPRLGPLVVSSVYEVEQLVAELGAEPAPPPRDDASLAAWAKQLAGAVAGSFDPKRWAPFTGDPRAAVAVLAEGRTLAAYFLGGAIGDLQHTLDLLAMTRELLALAPDDDFLGKQRESLDALRAEGVAKLRAQAVDRVAVASLGAMWHRRLLAALDDADPSVADARDRASPHPGPRTGWNAFTAVASLGGVARALPRLMGLAPTALREGFVNLTPGRSSPRDAAVFDAILDYPAWWHPLELPPGGTPGAIREGGGRAFLTATPAGARALAFSGDDEIAEHGLPPVPWWPAQGGEFISRLRPDAEALGLDPSAAHGVTLAGEQLSALRAGAEAFAVEATVSDWTRVDAPRLVRFPSWIVATGVTTEDAAGRSYQVAFTRQKHADAFAAKHGTPRGGWTTASGQALFERFLGETPPGLWVNPGAVAGSRRFNGGFLKVALTPT